MTNKLKKLNLKKLIASVLMLVFILLPVHAMALTSAELLRQKQYYEAQAAAAKAAAAKKAQEAALVKNQISTIEGQISQIEQDISSTDGQITSTEVAIVELEANIKTEEDNLAKQKERMHQVVTSWYMEGDTGGLFEAVLGSDSLSEVTTKEQYYESIRQEIGGVMDKINKLREELKAKKDEQTKKKSDLDNMQAQQLASRNSVELRKTQKNQILGMTLAQQSQYLQDAEKYKNEIAHISAQIAQKRRAESGNNGESTVVGGDGGYNVTIRDGLDEWKFVAFQCTSYAAWYWNDKLGKPWTNTRPGYGSAYNWYNLARDQGYTYSKTPKVGAIISWTKMPYSDSSGWHDYGHVAIVEAVLGDGRINISEYNYSVPEGFGRRSNVDPSYYSERYDGDYWYIY